MKSYKKYIRYFCSTNSKQGTHLPVMVDVTHSTGRKDIMLPTAKAALAVGADV